MQQQTKWAGDMQAGRISSVGCLFEQTLLFSTPSTFVLQLVPVLPFAPPCFPPQCRFSCCFIFPVGSFPLQLTLPCQSSSRKQHFSCCFHTSLLAAVCHPLVLCPSPPGDLNVSGAGTTWCCAHPVLCATGPLYLLIFFSRYPNKCD